MAGNATLTVTPPTADTVIITKAVYHSKKNNGKLSLQATSSASTDDPATLPILQITHVDGVALDNAIDMTYNSKKNKYMAEVSWNFKPGTVTVTSSAGGSATSAVGGK